MLSGQRLKTIILIILRARTKQSQTKQYQNAKHLRTKQFKKTDKTVLDKKFQFKHRNNCK